MMEQRSDEWFAARRGRVTASMAGAILGLDPNCSREEAMRRMVRSALGAESEFKGNVATVWGVSHEDEAREDFKRKVGKEVTKASFCVSDMGWIGASPDGFVDDDAVIEIKCPYGLRADDPPIFKTLEDQPHYYAQVQVQMFCTGRSKAYFWQWTPYGDCLEVHDYDVEWIAENLPKLEAFYEEFLQQDPAEHLQSRRVVIDTPRALQMCAEYDDLSDSIAKAEERRKELLEALVDMADGRNAQIGTKKLTKVEKAGAVSYAKAVKELLPGADLTKWTGKPTSYWTFK